MTGVQTCALPIYETTLLVSLELLELLLQPSWDDRQLQAPERGRPSDTNLFLRRSFLPSSSEGKRSSASVFSSSISWRCRTYAPMMVGSRTTSVSQRPLTCAAEQARQRCPEQATREGDAPVDGSAEPCSAHTAPSRCPRSSRPPYLNRSRHSLPSQGPSASPQLNPRPSSLPSDPVRADARRPPRSTAARRGC